MSINAAATLTGATKPTVVLVHGAFADSSSWNGVIDDLQRRRLSGNRGGQPAPWPATATPSTCAASWTASTGRS